jgi:hypothetical protein
MVGGLSGPQERILRWLGGFSPAMEKAWDVTRHLSLPGISEALGVVRSALNAPLSTKEKHTSSAAVPDEGMSTTSPIKDEINSTHSAMPKFPRRPLEEIHSVLYQCLGKCMAVITSPPRSVKAFSKNTAWC